MKTNYKYKKDYLTMLPQSMLPQSTVESIKIPNFDKSDKFGDIIHKYSYDLPSHNLYFVEFLHKNKLKKTFIFAPANISIKELKEKTSSNFKLVNYYSTHGLDLKQHITNENLENLSKIDKIILDESILDFHYSCLNIIHLNLSIANRTDELIDIYDDVMIDDDVDDKKTEDDEYDYSFENKMTILRFLIITYLLYQILTHL